MLLPGSLARLFVWPVLSASPGLRAVNLNLGEIEARVASDLERRFSGGLLQDAERDWAKFAALPGVLAALSVPEAFDLPVPGGEARFVRSSRRRTERGASGAVYDRSRWLGLGPPDTPAEPGCGGSLRVRVLRRWRSAVRARICPAIPDRQHRWRPAAQ